MDPKGKERQREERREARNVSSVLDHLSPLVNRSLKSVLSLDFLGNLSINSLLGLSFLPLCKPHSSDKHMITNYVQLPHCLKKEKSKQKHQMQTSHFPKVDYLNLQLPTSYTSGCCVFLDCLWPPPLFSSLSTFTPPFTELVDSQKCLGQ